VVNEANKERAERDRSPGRRIHSCPPADRRPVAQALADRLGVSFQQVQKYENGTNRVGAGRLPQIAEILNIPISALFSANAEASSGRAESVVPINLMPDRSALRLLTSFSRVSDRAIRRGLVDLVAAIAKAIPAKTPQGRDDTST